MSEYDRDDLYYKCTKKSLRNIKSALRNINSLIGVFQEFFQLESWRNYAGIGQENESQEASLDKS